MRASQVWVTTTRRILTLPLLAALTTSCSAAMRREPVDRTVIAHATGAVSIAVQTRPPMAPPSGSNVAVVDADCDASAYRAAHDASGALALGLAHPQGWFRIGRGYYDNGPPDSVRIRHDAQGGDSPMIEFYAGAFLRWGAGPRGCGLRPVQGAFRVQYQLATVVAGDPGHYNWVALTLTETPEQSTGWPTDRDAAPAFLVRPNGRVQLFYRGAEVAVRWDRPVVDTVAARHVSLRLRVEPHEQGLARMLDLELDGSRCTVQLEAGPHVLLPPQLFLEVGAHFGRRDQMPAVLRDIRVGV